MHIKDNAAAQGWFIRHAAAPSSKGAWKAFVARNKREQEPQAMAQGGRIGFALGTRKVKKTGETFGKWLVNDFYTKPGGAMPNPDGSGIRDAYFDSKPKALAAIKQRNITMGELTGKWSGKDLNKFYKKEIKLYGYEGTDWEKIPQRIRRNIIARYIGRVRPKASIAKWKKEGLLRRVNEETRRLLDLYNPVNPKSGTPYTLKEWTKLPGGVRQRILNELKGKPRRMDRRWADMKEGWYPNKNDNRLLAYMRHAAKQQADLNIPLKERTYINVYETDPKLKGKKRFVGVREVKTNALWTHVDYDLSKPGAKIGKVITGHPDMTKFLTYFNEAQKFKYERPTALLKDYFSKYSRVPTYNEIYNFFTMHAGTKPHTLRTHNALTLHHQNLMRNKPTKNFQLLINKYNSKADTILRNSLKKSSQKGYITKAEAIRQLKAIGARVEGMGIKASEIAPKKGLALAKKEAVNKFKAVVKDNPAIVDQMAKRLGLDKKQKIILRKRLNSGIPIDTMARMLSSDFRIPVGKIMGALGNVAKVIGVGATPLNVIPYTQEIDRGMGIRSIDTGTARLAEDFLNMPKYVTQLAGALLKKDWDLPYEAKFGRMYADWVAKGIPLEKRIKNIEKLALDEKYRDDILYSASGEADMIGDVDVEKLKKKTKTPLLPERGELEIKKTENVFGTQIPMKSITEGFSRDQRMVEGGRVGLSAGGWLVGLLGPEAIIFEYVFYKASKNNYLSQGYSEEEAKAMAIDEITLGITSKGDAAYNKELDKVAKEMGLDSKAFDTIREISERNIKVKKQQERDEQLLESGYFKTEEAKNKFLDKREKLYGDYNEEIEKLWRKSKTEIGMDKAGKVFPTPNLDQIATESMNVEDADVQTAFGDLQKAATEKLRKRKSKAFDVQSKQVETDQGWLGNVLTDNLFNLQSIPRTLKTAWNLFDPRTPLPKLDDLKSDAALEQAEIEKMDNKELYLYNKRRGIEKDNPITPESLEEIQYKYPELQLRDGGIASLMKKKW